MKQRKWLRHAAKALVLAMILSLTLCVTAHAENGWGFLHIHGVDTSDITVTVDNALMHYTNKYYEGYKFPSYSKITVHFGQDVDAGFVSHVTRQPVKMSYYEMTYAAQEAGDTFSFVWTAIGEHNIHIGAAPVVVDPADPTDPGKTDPTDPGKTDPTDPGKTDPTDPGKTDPTDPGKTDPTDPGNTDPTDPGKTDPTDPGKTDPTDPGKTDPTDPGKTDPADPADPGKPADPTKPSTGDTMLITLWAVVLMGTAVGITALVRSKKRA